MKMPRLIRGDWKMEPMIGFEPMTDGLRNRCSTTELHWQPTIYTRCRSQLCAPLPGRFPSTSTSPKRQPSQCRTHPGTDPSTTDDSRAWHRFVKTTIREVNDSCRGTHLVAGLGSLT